MQSTPSEYNQIRNSKAFDVSAIVTAYHFPFKPLFEPYFEQYNFSQIIFVISGNGLYTTEEGCYRVGPGMMFYRPAYKKSKYEWLSEHANFALISFLCESEAMKVFERPPFFLYEEESSMLLDLMKTAARICEPIRGKEPLHGMRLKSDVPHVVLSFVCSSLERFLAMVFCRLEHIDLLLDESQKANRFRDDSDMVTKIKLYLSEQVSRPLTMEQVCTHFGIGQTSLTKKFRKETGQGVMEYFTDLKISEAKQKIRTSALSFTQIADALGFSSVNYFSKVFKAKVGITPTEYSKFVSKRRIASSSSEEGSS